MQIGSIYKVKPEISSTGKMVYITDFAFPVGSHDSLIIIHDFYGINEPLGILAYAYTEEQFTKRFDLYMSMEDANKLVK